MGAYMIKVAIVEDDKQAAKQLIKFMEQYEKENDVVFEPRWFAEGLSFLDEYECQYEVIFMDIDMPYKNGMDVAEQLRKMDEKVELIFVTNLAQYAVEGYMVQAMGFLVKPIDYYQFSLILKKVIRKVQGEKTQKHHLLKTTEGMVCIDMSSVYYIEVQGHYLHYHCADKVWIVRGSINKVEDELVKMHFARCNNCYMVNMYYVKSISKDKVTVGTEQLKISRGKSREFMERLTHYMGEEK